MHGKVNTFNLRRKPSGVKSLAELYDGRVISLILHDVDPKYFGDVIIKGGGTFGSVNWVQHFNVCKFPQTS